MNGKLPQPADAGAADMAHSARESWRIFGIMSEFVEATERLSQIRPAVSIFGSARAPVDSPYYLLAEKIARLLSDAGFSVISGGGPGISLGKDAQVGGLECLKFHFDFGHAGSKIRVSAEGPAIVHLLFGNHLEAAKGSG